MIFIYSANGLRPSGFKVIWTSDGIVYLRKYALLGLQESSISMTENKW